MRIKTIINPIVSLQICVCLAACTDFADEMLSEDASSSHRLEVITQSEINLSGLNPELNIARVRRFAALDPNGERFVLADDEFNKLHMFDINGQHLNSFGGSGRGPTEFIRINAFGMDENGYIITYDASQDLIRGFHQDGSLAFTHEGLLLDGLWNRSDRISVANGKLIFSVAEAKYSSSSDFWKSALVAVYNYDGELQYLMGSHDPVNINTDRLYKFAYHEYDRQNNIVYLSQRVNYRILAFGMGEKVPARKFGFKAESYKVWKDEARVDELIDERRAKNVQQSFSNLPFSCENYFFYHYMNMTEDFYESRSHEHTDFYFSVFEKETYRYLGSYQFQDSYALAVTDDCRIITLVDDDPDRLTLGLKEIKVIPNSGE
ncbi:MAG: 6-bladed beta-propeller [Balneolaceae bacterium]|nr:MAG: 6-bladed beta-propeller [Balneolaceae bacterium]